MQPTTLIFMTLVLGVLWGGFAALLAHSMKAEKRRAAGAGAEAATAADADEVGGDDDD